ncbi:MAG: apolipoprotein N-acyltransferase [Bacteroidetes bacterium]|nr:apolipoprotein N-acyltransferase [Bacteroidota bacterium]
MKSFFRLDPQKRYFISLSFSSAFLISFSFPPFPLGVFACVGMVPLLLLADLIESYGRFFRYSYCTFFVLSILALYWVGGFTHGHDPYLMIAGIALFLWEPLVFTIPAMLYFFVKKRIRQRWAVISFPFIWISMEWLYALGELAFPWLHLGNTQTYQLEKIQFADLTGVYGISFWILVMNVLVYFLVKSIQAGVRTKSQYYLVGAILGVYLLPNFYTAAPLESLQPNGKGITVGILQPNIDPWNKWEGAKTFQGRWTQTVEYLRLMERKVNDSLDLFVLPESAILLDLPQLPLEMEEFKNVVDKLKVSVISGYVHTKFYEQGNAPVSSSTLKGRSTRYDSFNSILYVQPDNDTLQTYNKMRLVPFAERIPYANKVPFLIEPLRWGVGISNWGLAHDSTVFSSQQLNTKFLAMVCYESIFPEFVSQFVQKGAEFLVFTTNDSWWGNTSGARQHNQYAVLRAVENRRWVVRCANGGISSFIDPCGKMYDKTEMYTEAYIQRKIQPYTALTFYSLHGDWLARICASIALLFFLFSIGYAFFRKPNE